MTPAPTMQETRRARWIGGTLMVAIPKRIREAAVIEPGDHLRITLADTTATGIVITLEKDQ